MGKTLYTLILSVRLEKFAFDLIPDLMTDFTYWLTMRVFDGEEKIEWNVCETRRAIAVVVVVVGIHSILYHINIYWFHDCKIVLTECISASNFIHGISNFDAPKHPQRNIIPMPNKQKVVYHRWRTKNATSGSQLLLNWNLITSNTQCWARCHSSIEPHMRSC